jgi:group II intron reverse transcriptase/maturase
VVDVDLEKFFDRVNHDVLMSKLRNRIADRRMRRTIRRFLEAGIMADGVVMERHEGTPQGGPLSPLLANVLLDDVDKELERRGHRFVRYADDCNIYVRSKRAGERALAVLRRKYVRLRLRINEEKSAVARVWDRKFLGYSFWVAKGREVKRRVAPKALEELKRRTRAITRRNGGRSMEQVCNELGAYLRGWKEYFRLSDTPGVFRELDKWLHHRLRAIHLKHSRRSRCWWRSSALGTLHSALPGSHFERLGVPRLASPTSTH